MDKIDQKAEDYRPSKRITYKKNTRIYTKLIGTYIPIRVGCMVIFFFVPKFGRRNRSMLLKYGIILQRVFN